MGKRRKDVAVGERGVPLGEDHPGAKLTDEQVEHMRELYEEGLVGYRALAKAFGVSRDTARQICIFRRRATTPVDWKTKR